MGKQRSHTPEIQHVEPPPIMVYSVTGDRLDRIEEACSHVGYDFTFAVTSLSVGVTLLATYFTVPQLTDKQQALMFTLMILCLAVLLYTGIRWLRSRNKAVSIIDAIRGSDQPESK